MSTLPAYMNGHAKKVIEKTGMPADLVLGGAAPVSIIAAIRSEIDVAFPERPNPQQDRRSRIRALWSDIGSAVANDTITQGGITYKFIEPPHDNGYGIGEAPLDLA